MTVLRGWRQSRGQHDSYHERLRLPCAHGRPTAKATTRTLRHQTPRGDQARRGARWCGDREATGLCDRSSRGARQPRSICFTANCGPRQRHRRTRRVARHPSVREHPMAHEVDSRLDNGTRSASAVGSRRGASHVMAATSVAPKQPYERSRPYAFAPSRATSWARRIMERKELASITMAPIQTRLMNGLVLTSLERVSLALERSEPGRASMARPPLLGAAFTIVTVPPLGRYAGVVVRFASAMEISSVGLSGTVRPPASAIRLAVSFIFPSPGSGRKLSNVYFTLPTCFDSPMPNQVPAPFAPPTISSGEMYTSWVRKRSMCGFFM